MKLNGTLFDLPNESELSIVYGELGLNADRLENNLKLLKEWIKCENHLPNDIDEKLLESFLLCCKGNLDKTKTKLETFLVAKTKITFYYSDLIIKDYQFPYEKCMTMSRKLTPKGNRVVTMRLHTTDTTNFVLSDLHRYLLIVFNVLLYSDTVSGYDFIYDVRNFHMQHLANTKVGNLKNFVQLMYNVLPFRTRSIHIIQINAATEFFLTIAKVFMSKKLKERICNTKIEELPKIFPKECIPADYGGTDDSMDEKANEIKEFLNKNRDWCEWVNQLKLTGPVPENKKSLYSFEDSNMDGSFRKLVID